MFNFGLVALAIWQGGFSDIAWCFGGVVCAVFLLLRGKELPSKSKLYPFLALLGVYLLTAALHGRLENWMTATKVAVALLFVICLSNSRPNLKQAITATGLIVAIAGILAYAGLLPLPGALSDGRLQGLFQYANATGLFLGVCAFMTRLWHSRWATLMEIALLLTQSLGAIAVYLVGWVCYFVLQKTKHTEIGTYLARFMFSALGSVGMMFCSRSGYAFFAPVVPVILVCFDKYLQQRLQKITGQRFFAPAALGLLAVGGIIFAVRRGGNPLGTYLERLIQISDGLSVVILHPFGLGPGAWAFLSRTYQTADYSSVLLHSGYAQVGVDAGIPALLLIGALLFCWFRQKLPPVNRAASLMILAHAALDISFVFLAIVFLLCLLTCLEPEPVKPRKEAKSVKLGQEARSVKPVKIAVKISGRMALIALIAVFALLLVAQAEKNQAKWLALEGDFAEAGAALNRPLLQTDTEAILLRMSYAMKAGDLAVYQTAFAALPDPNSAAYYMDAQVWLSQGEYEEAAAAALACIKAAPLAEDGYEMLTSLLPRLSKATKERYATEMERCQVAAQKKEHFLAPYLYTR